MKLTKTKNILLVAAMAISLSSCQDMFSPDADNVVGEERAIVNPQTLLGFLNTGYILLPNSYNFSECVTDDAVINDPTSDFLPMAGGAWGPMFDPTSIWSSSYKAIDNINKFLTYAPTMEFSWNNEKDDSLYRERSFGEAYGLRGYHHFLLLKSYGGNGNKSGKMLGVPYLRELVDLNPAVWRNIERLDYKTTVENIIEDLDSAYKYLPDVYSGTDRVYGVKNTNRLTTWITLAMKAQVYMHAASPKYNEGNYHIAYCDSAIKYSSMLIDRIGGVGALSGLLDKDFYSKDANQTNAEILWRMNQATEATSDAAMALTIEAKNYPPSMSGKGLVNPTQDFVDAFPGINGYPITDTKSNYDATKPYLKRDPRLDTCVVRNGGYFGGRVIKTSKDDPKDGIENPGATRTGYYLKKLLRPDFSITNPVAGKKTVRPLIRYTEMFLIYAEAATAIHGADWMGTRTYSARSVIRAIRKRGGIVPDIYATNLPNDQFMDLVRNERRIELAFEGHRFWDLRRWGLETNVTVHRARILTVNGLPEFLPMNDETRNFVTFKYFAPIPNNETLKCPKLEQNTAN